MKTLVNEPLPTSYSLLPTPAVWDGRSEDGVHVPGGVYFRCLTTEGFTAAREMVLMR